MIPQITFENYKNCHNRYIANFAPNVFKNLDITLYKSIIIFTVLFIACAQSKVVPIKFCLQKFTGGDSYKTSHPAQMRERGSVTGPAPALKCIFSLDYCTDLEKCTKHVKI